MNPSPALEIALGRGYWGPTGLNKVSLGRFTWDFANWPAVLILVDSSMGFFYEGIWVVVKATVGVGRPIVICARHSVSLWTGPLNLDFTYGIFMDLVGVRRDNYTLLGGDRVLV